MSVKIVRARFAFALLVTLSNLSLVTDKSECQLVTAKDKTHF